jgi:hypothetical protein
MAGGLLTKRALLLAKVETVIGQDALPTATADAVLVSEPDYTTDPQVLERDFVSNSLSKFEHIVGRVIAGFQFTVDLRGNGVQNSGLVTDAPMLATLMRGCGYELTGTDGTGALNLSDIVSGSSNSKGGDTTWAKGGTMSLASPVLYTIEVVTAGASGVAEVLITNNNTDEDDLSAAVAEIVTSGAALNLGASGGTITPTFTVDLVAGDKFFVQAWPIGVKAQPRSNDFEALTLYLYLDGLLHKGFAGMGTFTIDATAGDFGKVTFNFTTTFETAVDVPMPNNPIYETTIPPQMELALLTWGGNKGMCAEQWTFDAANDIQPRMCINKAQGYAGSRVTDRAPEGGFNPEVYLEADEPFWADYLQGKSKVFTVRAGTKAGEQIILFCPVAQTSEQSYGDRNGVRTYEKSVMFKRNNGDDEAVFMFC